MSKEELILYVLDKLRVTWDKEEKSDDELKEAIEDCTSMFKRLSNDLEKTVFSDDDANWIKRACKEIIQRTDDGLIGVKEYQESGLKYTFQRENISRALILELFPMVGYPK